MKVCVVLRTLPMGNDTKTVVSAVFTEAELPSDRGCDYNVKNVLEGQARFHIDQFKDQFVEFHAATWEIIVKESEG